ncbi:conserved Plasmodium protein, unknown function [Plasmodium knowlesi strain H]|uniref:Uncharacterized protein n=3 Tax=Plasmodium knowlesi TaxID=5850 RepID=A0A1A7VME9_PLAKH|nr:conserved Plasmodium protein, unknown function [Plasmodium knowlesi strain H]OTN65703.1 Uncharacterized protein PKNOH_S110110600 [Plasmodium knowlesi]CAA9989723.1 conserved Plasmodium protein, unknown function [Plasmodium knowlesi strain H]SBO22877.1 conserved Plasmodium protein, unknown function [Plasmodium knowlesi strain H]SBO23024.1 conserved Plasmodium protein, unknown function [Plasmodium knowlesi strain H]VVS79197.1 conserved Plasmodium protein, unknown function [Plasmodium knowlesi 
MLIQKSFSLVPAEDKSLENLVNELAQSKKNIRKIQNYGAKERSADSSIHKDYVNQQVEKLTITSVGSRQNTNTSEKDKWCSFRQKKNNADKGLLTLSPKYKKNTLNCSKNDKETRGDPSTSAKFDLSSIKENELFQRIFKTVERENIKCKNEKLKSKSEKLKHLKNNLGNQNEHVKRKNVNEENKDQLTELISEFRKILSDKKKTYATLKIRTRSFQKERASFPPFPDNDVEYYNMHYNCNGRSFKNDSWEEDYEKSKQREKKKENTKMQCMGSPYQNGQDRIAKGTAHRSSHNQKGCSAIRVNQNRLIKAEHGNDSHYFTKRSNTFPQKEQRNEHTYRQFENPSIMWEKKTVKGKKLPPKWEEKSSRSSSSRGNKSQCQYYIRSCSSNFSVPSSNNHTECENRLSVAYQKDKICKKDNDGKKGGNRRKDNNGKKRGVEKRANTLDNKLCNYKNKRSHTCGHIFRNAYTTRRRATKYKLLHRRLPLINDHMEEHNSHKYDNSCGKKFQYLAVKKRRKKINMTIFAKKQIKKHMHEASGGNYTLEEKSPIMSPSEYANSIKDDYHNYSPIRSIEHTRENSNGCEDDQFYQDMFISCERELKNHLCNSNNEDEKNSSHVKESNKNDISRKDVNKMNDYVIFPHNSSETGRDRLTTNGKAGDEMNEIEADVCVPKGEDQTQNTGVDPEKWENAGNSKIKIQDRRILKEQTSFNCEQKEEANLKNSNGEIADLLSHATGNAISRRNTTSNIPCERELDGDFDEPTEHLKRENTSIMGHKIIANRGTHNIWKDPNPVKLNKELSELPHRGKGIKLGKQNKEGNANCITTDLRDDTQNHVLPNQQGNNRGKEHILQEILSFYTRYKNKLNFLLQEEYNYLCRLRDYVRKNTQESEEMNKDDSVEGTSTHENCEEENVLINELMNQINKCISKKNVLQNSCDEGDVPTNRIKKCHYRKGKENFIYYLYKDDADVHQICIQTDERIKQIKYYLNQNQKKCWGKNHSTSRTEAPSFGECSPSGSSSNKSEFFCKDTSVECNPSDCPFERADMTNLRTVGEEMKHMRIRKRNLPSWKCSTLTKRTRKETFISTAMNKKVLVRKNGSLKKDNCSKINFKYQLLHRIKVSKYLLQNFTKLGGHYRASWNYLLRGLKFVGANILHHCDKNELHFKGSLSLFNYKSCFLQHFKSNTFYCYILCEKKRGNFRKRLSNAPNRGRELNYQHAKKLDQREYSNYLSSTDWHTVWENNKKYQNVERDRKNKEGKIFTMPTPICERNIPITGTNTNFSHITFSPVYAGESFTKSPITSSVMKDFNNSIPCSWGKDITKNESDSFSSTNLRCNQKSTPDLCGTMWKGKGNTEEGATCESFIHGISNSKWATSTSTYITRRGAKNNPLKNDTPKGIPLHQGKINLNTAKACHVNPNLLSDKDKREQLYDNTADGIDCMQSADAIKSLGIKNWSTINGKLICEQNNPSEKYSTGISHHIGGVQEENSVSSNEKNYLKKLIPVKHTSAHFKMSDKCRKGGEDAEWLIFPSEERTVECPPRSECYINVYGNNFDRNESLGKSKNMYRLNCSYDKIVNSLCTSRGKMAQENVGKKNNCKKGEKYKKQPDVINDEEDQNGKVNLSKLWVDNSKEVSEQNIDSNTPNRGNDIPRDKLNVSKSDSSSTPEAVNKYYVDLHSNGDSHSRYNIGAKLKKKKKKANNIPHVERDENENMSIQNVNLLEKEKIKGNSPEKEITQGERDATQMHHIGRDRKGVGTTICSSRNSQQNGQLSSPFDATYCKYKGGNDHLDKHLNFEKRESNNFFNEAVDISHSIMQEENSKPFKTHGGISQNEVKTKWEKLKRSDYNLEEYTNFTNSLNGRREENYFFPSRKEKHNLRKLKYDISEHIYGDMPVNWNPYSSTSQKETIYGKECTAQKVESPRLVQNDKKRENAPISDENTLNKEYFEKINDHFSQSHFSDFYNSNSFSQGSNFAEQDWGVRRYSNSCSISHNFINTNKLDQIIEKIKKWNEDISSNVNYVQCLFCDTYLFKVENHHDRDILNCTIDESIRREKYTCAICKHKIRTLRKYNDEVKIGEQVVDTQKGDYSDGKLKDGKKYILHNAEGAVDFLKTEKLENSLINITCSGSNKISTSIRTDASLNSDILKNGDYISGRKSENGNVLGENCGSDDPLQFANCGTPQQALSFDNRNLNYPRDFAIFDDTVGNGSRDSNIDSSLFRFEQIHPRTPSDSDSSEAIDRRSTRSSVSGENLAHTYSLDKGMTTQEWGKLDYMGASQGRQFEHTHGEDDNDADVVLMRKTSMDTQNPEELLKNRDKTDGENWTNENGANVEREKKKKGTFDGEVIYK